LRSIIINISFFLLLPSVLAAQQDTTAGNKFGKYIPTGVRFGTDVFAVVRTGYDNSFDGWELNADIDFDRFYLTVDNGYWARDFKGSGNVYSNQGAYFRVGVDVNFLTKDPDKNMFFLGARYGLALFSEDLVIDTVDPVWGNFTTSYSNEGLRGTWFELTTGVRVKIWKVIWVGYTARFKFGLSTNDGGDMIPHDVPGYGRADKDSEWGFNYQVFFRLPVRKQ